jgi:hypothetical protein
VEASVILAVEVLPALCMVLEAVVALVVRVRLEQRQQAQMAV